MSMANKDVKDKSEFVSTNTSQDPLAPSGPESTNVQQRRAEWFFQQRAYPLGYVPTGARLRALEQLDQMQERERGIRVPESSASWTLVGPHRTDGLAAGRVSAMAIDPRNSDVI